VERVKLAEWPGTQLGQVLSLIVRRDFLDCIIRGLSEQPLIRSHSIAARLNSVAFLHAESVRGPAKIAVLGLFQGEEEATATFLIPKHSHPHISNSSPT